MNKIPSTAWPLAAVLLVSGLIGVGPANAESIIEEIVVTAQKREQNLQDVGISVTAFSGDAIEQLGFESALEVVQQVPNFAMRDAGTVPLLSIRGNQLLDFGDGNESPVAIYIDEVYRSTVVGQQPQLFDLERIEVLRGPQGTLYGRNATAGIAHFISRRPTDEFEGYVDLQLGSYSQRILEGAVGGAFTDAVRGRLSFKYNEDDGWQDNEGSPGGNNAATDIKALRAQLEFDLGDTATLLLKASGSDQDNTTTAYGFAGVLDPNTFEQCSPARVNAGACVNLAGFGQFDAEPDEIYSELREPENSIETRDLSAHLSWFINENLELTSITAYHDLDRRLVVDEDASETGAFGGFLQFVDVYEVDSETLTQEIRLSGNAGNTNWVAGVYWLDDEKKPVSTITALEFPPGTPDTVAQIDTKSWAVFGHVDMSFSEQLELIAGIRYTDDEKESDITTGGVTVRPGVDGQAVTGELGLNWTPNEDVLIYGLASKGFKSGELNSTLLLGDPAGAASVDEETVYNYEVGVKWTFPDGKGRFNASAFYQDIEGKQGTTIPGNSPVPTTRLINFGDVEITGAEFELFYEPIERLEIILGLALLDTEIDADPTAGVLFTWGTGANAGIGDFYPIDGTALPGAAETTVNGVVRYTLPPSDAGTTSFQVDFSWTDDLPGSFEVPYNEIESYELINLRANWSSPSGRYKVSAFVENVTDEEVELFKFILGGFDYQAIVWDRPRWAGVSVGMQF